MGARDLFSGLDAFGGAAQGVFDEAVEQHAELLDLRGGETGDDLGVPTFDHEHHSLPDAFALGRQGENHAADVRGTGLLAHQSLIDQGLRSAAGLTLVQVGPLREVVDR